MAVARIGAMTGNMLLPILLNQGCLPPFLLEGALFAGKLKHKIEFKKIFIKGISGATILSLLLPRTDQKALE